ncbi:MAG: Sir2 family NAD-dependent protein deacetylase, partial [bacterium]|nr:Sir2 family NAD-dependent protein deacetylase [bacterium]MDW8163638.1 Sir2 family NAD-dependent protein deacetylase [Candidatus Omnitrophota bacterium]
MNEVDELLSLIKNSNYLIVFTGAGISTESGIPSFRGKEGLWAKYRPEIYGTFTGLISQFLIKPSNVVNFIFDFTSPILEAKPNISHICLAKLEEKGYLKSIITQNIDNLHSDAGNKNVIELHGNLYIWRCKKCENIEKIGKEKLSEFAKNLKKIQGRRELIRYINNFVKCKCGGRKRPDIVFFGEPLP